MTPPFALHYDAWGRLVLTTPDGRAHIGVEPIRAFPISNPSQGISFCLDGHEVFWLDDLSGATAEQVKILDEELTRRHFLPVIHRVTAIDGITEPTRWQVETDRGPTVFSLKSEEDVRRVSGARVVITDAHGVRYLIHDLHALDNASQTLLSRYI